MKRFIPFIFLLSACGANISGDTKNAAKSAYDTLFEFKSRLSSGMNYSTFNEKIADVKVALDKFTSNSDSLAHPSYSFLTQAYREYDFSRDVWTCYVKNTSYSNNFFIDTDCEGPKLKSDYGVTTSKIGILDHIYLSTALNAVWGKAGENLAKAKEKL